MINGETLNGVKGYSDADLMRRAVPINWDAAHSVGIALNRGSGAVVSNARHERMFYISSETRQTSVPLEIVFRRFDFKNSQIPSGN